ncbi:phage virion morphogenesis protein [Lysobacter sp. CA199]|uniref:phage virion morphogenesis protein n=1 Tax=Lysobacter sp. CA199 TaxID=3455608 RepID=UPI003F8CFDD2
MDDLEQLEQWAGELLAKLEPARRRTIIRAIGIDLRRSQQQRIAQQRNPDGSTYAPRKRENTLRAKSGRVKRGAMFAKIKQAKHLRLNTTGDLVEVGFVGRVARIARVHQDGLADDVSPGGPRIRYERRQLLGFTAEDRERIVAALLDHLAK